MKENALSLDLISGKINLDELTDEQRQQAYNELRPYAKPADLIKEKEEQIKRAASKIVDSAPQRVNAAIQQLIRGDGLYNRYFCNVVSMPEVLHKAFVERGEMPVPMQDRYHLPIVTPDGQATFFTKANDKVIAERKAEVTRSTIAAVQQEAQDFYAKAMAKLPEQVAKGNALFKQLERERKEEAKLSDIIDQALAGIEAPTFEVKEV
ncbi:TPA: hypothetical protein ROA76_004364 [Escherichia coli]|nr:hypothetical protein [Escherichia coli]